MYLVSAEGKDTALEDFGSGFIPCWLPIWPGPWGPLGPMERMPRLDQIEEVTDEILHACIHACPITIKCKPQSKVCFLSAVPWCS